MSKSDSHASVCHSWPFCANQRQDLFLLTAGSEDESGGSDYEELHDEAGVRQSADVDTDDDAEASDEDTEGG